MKKLDLGQIITILANVGVIAGIIFLGYEIRQGNQVARQEAYNAFTQEINNINLGIANNGELAQLLARAGQGEQKDDFTPGEQLQIELLWIGLVRVWEGLYRSVQEGIADESSFDSLSSGVGPYGSRYFQAFWPEIRNTVDEDFAVFFESKIWE